MFNKHIFIPSLLLIGSIFVGVTSCVIQDHKIEAPAGFAPVQGPPFASGLMAPIGLTDDPKGNIWVTEAGSGKGNDGKVTVITPSGTAYPAITGFVSAISPENSPEGLNHLVYRDGKLYILHGVDEKLYIADVSGFVPGVSTPIDAGSLIGIDIGTFVRDKQPNAPDPKDSNPYNLTFGPNGDLFITDAGGNAIIRRDKTSGALSIYAIFPDSPNPTFPSAPMGPPTLDPVPTGIVFDGTNFFVTSLIGFPFPTGISKIYKVSGSDPAPVTPTVYKSGFSGLTDLAFTPGGKLVVTEFGFSGTGRVASGEDAGVTLFTPAITPVDIMLSTSTPDTYYVLFYGPGLIMKMKAN